MDRAVFWVSSDTSYQYEESGAKIPVGWNKSLLTLVGGAQLADQVQLDTVVDNLSLNFGANCADQLLDCGGPEFLHCAALYAHLVVMVMTNSAEAVHLRPVYRGKLADRPCLKKQLYGAEHRRPTHRRQLFAECLYCKAVLLLLQELGYGFPGSSGSIAQLLQHRYQVCVWNHKASY